MKSLLIGASTALLSVALSAQAQTVTFNDYRHSISTTTTTTVRCQASPSEVAADVKYEQTFNDTKGLQFVVSGVSFGKKSVSKEQLSQINKKVGRHSIMGVTAQCRGTSVRLIFALYGRSAGKPPSNDSFLVIREDDGSIQIL